MQLQCCQRRALGGVLGQNARRGARILVRMQHARTARHPSGCHLLRCAASADGDAPESSANDEEAGELEDVVEDELEDDFLNKKLRRILKVAADEASTLHANYGCAAVLAAYP